MTVVAEDYAPGTGRVAVLGLGTIGAGMARSLLRAGLPVRAWAAWTPAPPATACDPAAGRCGARSRTGCLPWSV
jgi:3-hydroxyisobutyrate dehydrogenase-like beta-hydroxyacid dehydrogenase